MSDSIDWSLDCALERDARRLDEPGPAPSGDPEVEHLVRADREGREAARRGVRLHECPYLRGSSECVYWMSAWRRQASLGLAVALSRDEMEDCA